MSRQGSLLGLRIAVDLADESVHLGFGVARLVRVTLLVLGVGHEVDRFDAASIAVGRVLSGSVERSNTPSDGHGVGGAHEEDADGNEEAKTPPFSQNAVNQSLLGPVGP